MTNLLGRAAAPCTGESATRYAAAGGGWHPSPSVQVGGWWEGSEAKVSEIGEEERGRERGRAAAPRPRGGGRVAARDLV